MLTVCSNSYWDIELDFKQQLLRELEFPIEPNRNIVAHK